MTLRLSIVAKLTALIVLLAALTALGVNQVYVRGGSRILVDDAVQSLEHETDTIRYPLDSFLDQFAEDARLIIQLPDARAALGGDMKSSARLGDLLGGLIRTTAPYRSIALFGADGRPVLTIGRTPSGITWTIADPVPPSIVQTALRSPAGSVSLSPPALERQGGQIANPYRLLLRVAEPLTGADGRNKGAVIITLDFGAVLQDIRKNLAPDRTLYVTDANGAFLLHSDPAALYAGELGHGPHLQDSYPALQMTLNTAGQSRLTLLPDTADGQVFTFEKYHYDPADPSRILGLAMAAPYRDVVGRVTELQHRGILISGGIALLSALIAAFLLRRLVRPLNQIAGAVVRYRQGDRAVTLPSASRDEIGILSREFGAMIRQKEEEDWIRESLVTISRGLLGFKALTPFADALITALCRATDAPAGALYTTGEFNAKDGDEDRLTLAGGCGLGADTPDTIALGEGLTGQCAKDRQSLLITDIPSDYALNIRSSLGNAAPRAVLLLPVLFETRLAGVIELASLHGFTEAQRTLLDQIAFTAGIVINSIAASLRTEELLEETRLSAEELQRSEEELKAQQEELQAANEEMEEKNRALEDQNTQIRRQAQSLDETRRLIEEKARELEQSSRYKSEFLANMSHELRTPLNSLLILARGFADNEVGNLTPDQIEEAKVIHNGAIELLTLINDILDLSKVEAGKLSVIAEETDPAAIARKMERQFEPIAREKNLRFVIDASSDLPRQIITDAQRVEQVLKNLLSNAFKFTGKGSVTLKIAPASDSAITFSVTDTGIGIDENKLRDIFEAFQQENGAIDRQYGGTGLGLTIARKLAHMLGGEISVRSVKGQGSTFVLTLPLSLPGVKKTALSVQPSNDDRAAIEAGDQALLVVEDDAAFAETLMKIVCAHGYKCLIANNGASALRLAADAPVAAILLDLKLPDMDGLTVLSRLKLDPRTQAIPVHVVSGREGAAEPLARGAIGFTAKPALRAALDDAFLGLEQALRGGAKRILVVEDDAGTRLAVEKLLQKPAVEIAFATTGAAAFAMARAKKYDCIILDLSLPDISGFDWLDQFETAVGDGNMPPVIVHTAAAVSEAEHRRLRRHTSSIVIKGAQAPVRLRDEVELFLHSLEEKPFVTPISDPDHVLENRTILVVDDDLRNSFALSKVLKRRGLQVTVADNGQMALDRLAVAPLPDLILMDIMMPVMDGYQAMRAIRAQSKFAKLPIIALTARAMPEEQEKCMAAGADDYLTKPVDLDRLFGLLRVLLSKRENA